MNLLFPVVYFGTFIIKFIRVGICFLIQAKFFVSDRNLILDRNAQKTFIRSPYENMFQNIEWTDNEKFN